MKWTEGGTSSVAAGTPRTETPPSLCLSRCQWTQSCRRSFIPSNYGVTNVQVESLNKRLNTGTVGTDSLTPPSETPSAGRRTNEGRFSGSATSVKCRPWKSDSQDLSGQGLGQDFLTLIRTTSFSNCGEVTRCTISDHSTYVFVNTGTEETLFVSMHLFHSFIPNLPVTGRVSRSLIRPQPVCVS